MLPASPGTGRNWVNDLRAPSSRTSGFHHVAIRSRNFDRSLNFYSRGLGFVQVRDWKNSDTRAVLLDMGGGAYIEIFERKVMPPATGAADTAIIHFAIRTTNCDATLELARRAGAEVTVEPKDIEIPSNPVVRARIAFFKGPDGETVELFEERSDP